MIIISNINIKRFAGTLAALLVLLSPVAASAVSDTSGVMLHSSVVSAIEITTSTNVAISLAPDGDGQASSASDTVLVSTNDPLGYSLVLENGDTTTSLSNGTQTIAAHTGTMASPSTLLNNRWGYRVDSAGSFGSGPTTAQTNVDNLTGTWAGILSSATAGDTIKTTAVVATDDATTVWYGVKADTSYTLDGYSDSVTYTATTNP